MTPYQLTLCAKAYREREIDARDTDMWHAWHTGAFSRIDRMPSLESVLTKSATGKAVPYGDAPRKLVGGAPPDKVGQDLMSMLMGKPGTIATKPKTPDGESPTPTET